MKTILGKKVSHHQFYKMEVWNTGKKRIITKGFICLEDGTSIRISGNKFHIVLKDLKTLGFISNKMKSYRQIKRMISIWFKRYRKENSIITDNSKIYRLCQIG